MGPGKETQSIFFQRWKKNYNIMIDGRNFFDQPVGNGIGTYDNIRKFTTSQEDDYTTLGYRISSETN